MKNIADCRLPIADLGWSGVVDDRPEVYVFGKIGNRQSEIGNN
jgi:hypothetical protein